MPILIDIRKLRVINQLIKDGAGNVASALETMTGVDAEVEIQSLSFVEPDDIPAEMGRGEVYSANVRLREPPYGVFLMTFPPETATEVAELMTGMDADGEFSDFHESALQEVCNVMTSGFIDGIANTLGTTIDMETPELRYADGEEIADETLQHIRTDALSIVLDSIVDIADSDAELHLRIFLVPDPGSFVNLIDKIGLDEVEPRRGDEDVAVGTNLEAVADDMERDDAGAGDGSVDAAADPDEYF